MKKILFLIALSWLFFSFTNRQKPVPVIFDSDIAPDYDDVGALALLHALADNGEAKILATISSNAFETTAPTLSVLNTYFKRPHIPVGVVKTGFPNHKCSQLWAQHIIAKYSHAVQSNEAAADAIKLYRKVLAKQKNRSVTIVTVGFFTNLSALLLSGPDEYSSLNGFELVQKKVKQLVSMAGAIDSTGTGGYEFNVICDIPAAKKVLDDWPTPITLSGFEIGVKIFTGKNLTENSSIHNSPVKDAYKIALDFDGSKKGRHSWDQTAVWVAVRGVDPWFSFRKINLTIKKDGKDSVLEGERIRYLTLKAAPEEMGRIIESLMMHQPSKK